MFVHIRCIFGHASCSLVAMLGNLSRPWTTASDQHEAKQAKQARTYDNITMKPTQASNAKAYTGIYTHEQVIRTTSDSNSDTTGASASALIASAMTRSPTSSRHDPIRHASNQEFIHTRTFACTCIYSTMHTKTMDHTSKPSLSKSPPADVEAMRFAPGTQFYFDAF